MRSKATRLFAHVVVFLKIRPTYYTFAGLFFSILYLVSMYFSIIVFAILFILLSGLMDVLDGLAARLVYSPTVFGAFIDSTLDRIEDGIYVSGLLFVESGTLNTLLVLVMLALTLLIPYISARARSLRLGKRETSIMERSDRIILLAIIIAIHAVNTILYSYFVLTYILLATYNIVYNIVSYQCRE